MKIRLCAVTTRAMTMRSFMVDTLNSFDENGFEITAICEPNDDVRAAFFPNIMYYPIKMKSGIVNPLSALNTVIKMVWLFRREKYDVIQYASTNAGLYAAIAARICRIPVRIFCQWGMMYVGSQGIKRFVYKNIEKAICDLSTTVQSDSPSNMEFAIHEGVVNRNKCEVIWNGSSTGVDTKKFVPVHGSKTFFSCRADLGIENDAVVFGYVGRINIEKGVSHLLDAFIRLRNKYERNLYLLIVGPEESDSELNKQMHDISKADNHVKTVGMSNNPMKYYSMMDYFVLPSYREGIATVLLEACSMGIPILSTNITGSTDVVVNGRNGYLFPPRNTDELERTMEKCLTLSETEYDQLSKEARRIAVECYDHDTLVQMLINDRKTK